MSFDIFLQFFKGGKATTIPRKLADAAFASYRSSDEGTCWVMEFPDGGHSEIFLDEGDTLDGMMISDPPNFMGFWSALFDLMKQTPAALFWDETIVVVDPAEAKELPPQMIESLGDPKIAKAPADFGKFIDES